MPAPTDVTIAIYHIFFDNSKYYKIPRAFTHHRCNYTLHVQLHCYNLSRDLPKYVVWELPNRPSVQPLLLQSPITLRGCKIVSCNLVCNVIHDFQIQRLCFHVFWLWYFRMLPALVRSGSSFRAHADIVNWADAGFLMDDVYNMVTFDYYLVFCFICAEKHGNLRRKTRQFAHCKAEIRDIADG